MIHEDTYSSSSIVSGKQNFSRWQHTGFGCGCRIDCICDISIQ